MKKKVYLLLLLFLTAKLSCIVDNNTHWFDQGVNAFNNKDYQHALDLFKKTIHLTPYSINAYFNAGLCCMHLIRWKQAANYFKKAANQNTRHFNAHFYCARSLRNAKNTRSY